MDSKEDLYRGCERRSTICDNYNPMRYKHILGRVCNILEHRHLDNLLYINVEYKVSWVGLNFIYQETSQSKECGMDRKQCGYMIRTSYDLPFASIISTKIHHKRPIWLDAINTHRMRLHFEVNDNVKEG